MIESLAEHDVIADDLVPALMTTHTVANPEYDPEEACRKAENFGNDLRENEAADDESNTYEPNIGRWKQDTYD